MRCERCDREATVRELVIRQGSIRQVCLCERCASEAGLGATSATSLLATLVEKSGAKPGGGATAKAPVVDACPSCGATYADFKTNGVLGCGACYDAFESKLGPLLERAHDGASTHTGKVPRRALANCRGADGGDAEKLARLLGNRATRERRLATLREMLTAAVRAEQYERAAAIRDEISRVEADPELPA